MRGQMPAGTPTQFQDVTWSVWNAPDTTGAQSGYGAGYLINIYVDYTVNDGVIAAGNQQAPQIPVPPPPGPIVPEVSYVMKGLCSLTTPANQLVTWRVTGSPDFTGAQSGYPTSSLSNVVVDYTIDDNVTSGPQANQVYNQLVGDAEGPALNNTVVAIQHYPVLSVTPTLHQVLEWNGTAWAPTSGSPPSGVAGGDLSGTYPNPTVVGLQGRPVSATAPTNGYVLGWNGSTWTPVVGPPPSGPAGGDLTGNFPNPTVAQIQGNPVSASAATGGQFLIENSGATGSKWTSLSGDVSSSAGSPGQITVLDIHGASVPGAGGLTTGNVLQVNGASSLTYAPVNLAGGSNYVIGTLPVGNLPNLSGDVTGTITSNTISNLQGHTVSASSPTPGYVLQYNGSAWVPAKSPGGPPSGTAGGDLTGTYPNPQVKNLTGDVSGDPINITPTILQWVASDAPAVILTQVQNSGSTNGAAMQIIAQPGGAGFGGGIGGDLFLSSGGGHGTYDGKLILALGSNPVLSLISNGGLDNTLQWASSVSSPTFNQPTVAAATTMTFASASSSGSGNNGGDFVIQTGAAGSGGSAGKVIFSIAGTPIARINDNSLPSALPGLFFYNDAAFPDTYISQDSPPSGNGNSLIIQSAAGSTSGGATGGGALELIGGNGANGGPHGPIILVSGDISFSLVDNSQILAGTSNFNFTPPLPNTGVNINQTIAGVGNGNPFTIQAQNSSASSSTGGNLILTSGVGTSTDGYVTLQIGGQTAANYLKLAASGAVTIAGLGGSGSGYVAVNNSGVLSFVSGVSPSGSAGGDLSGSYPNPTVAKIDGASVPAAGSLTTGNVLQVSGASALTYAAVNLGGGSNYVTGTLPAGNQAAQTMGGAVGGTTAASTINLTGNASIIGALPVANLADGTAAQVLMTSATPATKWTTITGDVSLASNGATTVTGVQGIAVPSPSGTNTLLTYNSGAYSWSTNSATVTWANDLVGSTNSNQYVAAISGNAGAGGTIPVNATTLQFASGQSSPAINQASTSAANGQNLTITAQGTTHSSSNGGNLYLSSGLSSTGTDGYVALQIGGIDQFQVGPSNITVPNYLGGTAGVVHNSAAGVLSSSLIVNADIASAAAIAVSKLANGTADQLLDTNHAGTTAEWFTVGGDVSFSSHNFTVTGIQGNTFTSGSPTKGQFVVATSTSNYGPVTLSGDLSESGTTAGSVTVVGLQGISVPSPSGSNTVLTYNSGAYSWGAGGGGGSVTWANDLVNSTSTNQYVSSLSYSSSAAGGTIVINGTGTALQWASGNTGPAINQAAPASSSSGNGTAAVGTSYTAQAGGATTGSATTAGVGGNVTVGAGTGGSGSGGTNANGGAGGNVVINSGAGGAKSGSGTVGANGNISLQLAGTELISISGATAGNITFTNTTAVPNITQTAQGSTSGGSGAAGSNFSITAQTGQAATGAAHNGGAGGNVVLQAGAGGTSGSATAGAAGYINVKSALVLPTATKTTNYTLTYSDYHLFSNFSAGHNLTLPAPINGLTFEIWDISGTAETNNITLVRNGSEKISGVAASRVLSTNWGHWTITSDGTDWYVG
jgi:hypothetical protein